MSKIIREKEYKMQSGKNFVQVTSVFKENIGQFYLLSARSLLYGHIVKCFDDYEEVINYALALTKLYELSSKARVA